MGREHNKQNIHPVRIGGSGVFFVLWKQRHYWYRYRSFCIYDITDAVTNIYAAGLTLDLGLPSRAKWFFMWFDRDDFLAIETPANNYYGIVAMFPVTLSEIIPIRYNASGVALDTADRFFLVGSYYSATTGSDSGYGVNGIGNLVNANTSVWAANEDGTITISRFGTAANYLFAGTYHWIAVC